MDELIELDKKILLFFNSFHTPWLDPVMLFLTKTFVWLPLYLFLVYLIFREYKKDGWIVLLGIVVTILITDRVTSGIMKPFFERLRPSNEPTLKGLVYLVDGYTGGLYGFASSHAANTMGTAVFFWLVFRKTKRWIWLLFVWAVGMTYTRLYLGVHYPGDILVGGMIGILGGFAGYRFQKWLGQQVDRRRINNGNNGVATG